MNPSHPDITEPLYKPFIERYVLDELKTLRTEIMALDKGITKRVAEAKLESTDRALQYTTDTVNNIFFIITAATSILVLFGWRSLREVKSNLEQTVADKVSEVTQEYEERLNDLEAKLRHRSEQIITAQRKISEANQIHSLWMRAGLEESTQERINIYNQILEVNPEDVEALTYKADALLELGETRWALSLSDEALRIDAEYALAYWQRACAYAELDDTNDAIRDLATALEHSPALKEEVTAEPLFAKLLTYPAVVKMLEGPTVRETVEQITTEV